MQAVLGSEFPAFRAALAAERTNAIRVNDLKLRPERLEALLGFSLEPVPWSPLGRYVPFAARLGSHGLHHAGAYYVQEASAQAVALALAPRPDERVLDLCAAPGGKSTHLAALMRNSGVLVCNEINPARARVLAENLERLGCIGTVTNEDPARLAAAWGASFDRVLVDAPCSGEGMFRKNPEAARDWSPGAVLACARRQADILESAARLLRPGGVLVYSTCTFAPEENEETIAQFLEKFPDFTLEPIPGFRAGLQGIGVRLMPHELCGEGHFIARLRKSGVSSPDDLPPEEPVKAALFGRSHALARPWTDFKAEFGLMDDGLYGVFRDSLQRFAPGTPRLDGLRALRAGVPVAQMQRDRLEPHHALALFSDPAQNEIRGLNLEPSDPRVAAYLRGESFESEGEAGWLTVRVAGLGLGWGKRVGRAVKNHYPKSLRAQTSRPAEDDAD